MSPDPLEDLRNALEELAARAREAGVEIELASEMSRLAGELEARQRPEPMKLEEPMQHPGRFGMIGDSAPMQAVYSLIERVAASDVSVLVQGETGTGKELVARALHEHGERRDQPFLAENCAAVPANLLESELFGHTKGSFTGAVKDRPGHFVAASGGTVFLDEIGDMPLEMQAKLLRVLQDGEVRPVGSNSTVKVDVRVVAATHRDLAERSRTGEFREDLFFRLNVITIKLPALRERPGDIAHLASYFLARIGEEMGKPTRLEGEALAALEAWHWPGNVRELENELQRAVALSSGIIGKEDLSPRVLEALGDGD